MTNTKEHSDRISIQAVIFDLDGTLLDTEALSDQAILDAFGSKLLPQYKQELNGRLPWDIKGQILGMRGSEWIPMVIHYAQQHWNIDFQDVFVTQEDHDVYIKTFWKAWETRLNELCSNVVACPGALELVEGLSNLGVPMAIATSSRLSAVQKKRIKHEKMFQHIPIIVTGDDPAVKRGKPAPDIYIEAARRLGICPTQCLVVEDALTGAQAGHAAGCQVLAVPDVRMEKQVFVDSAHVILDSLLNFKGDIWNIDLDLTTK